MATKLLTLRRVGRLSAGVVPVTTFRVFAEETGEESKKIKISELPLYGNPEDKTIFVPEVTGPLEKNVSSVRKVVWKWLDSVKETTDVVKEKWEIGKAHTQSTIDYIQEDPGMLPRIGVISVAGLLGIIAGYKGTVLKKTFYSTFAVLTAASICYPKEAIDITTRGYDKVAGKVTAQLPESWQEKIKSRKESGDKGDDSGSS